MIELGRGEKTHLKLLNAKGKIKWKTSSKRIIKIKKKSKGKLLIKAKKKGVAFITATHKKKKYRCKIKVY